MHDSAAVSATRARPPRETPSVSATNDGTTASGFTIVSNVVNETSSTFDSGIVGIVLVAVARLRRLRSPGLPVSQFPGGSHTNHQSPITNHRATGRPGDRVTGRLRDWATAQPHTSTISS